MTSMTLSQQLTALLGPKGWLSAPRDTAAFTRDWLNTYGVQPLGVARPQSSDETAALMHLCHAAHIPVVPQGGGTGLVGASVASSTNSVILSLSRLDQIDAINPRDFSAVVGAGVVLEQLHQALSPHRLMLPLHLGSQGSAQIGGLIAANAGGSHAFRFGTMQDLVLGLEVVLPNGDVWDGTRSLIKDNAGFQLRKLFCGSEGRLGVITRAVLKLYPAAQSQTSALLALPSLAALLQVGQQLRTHCAEFLTALEFFDAGILALALHHLPTLRWPLASQAPFYLLVELASSLPNFELEDVLQQALAQAVEAEHVSDAIVAQSTQQRTALWQVRETLPEGIRREGQQLKHDIAVPLSQFPSFLSACHAQVQHILPGTRIWTFGHLGDGNIHYNLSPPAGSTDFSQRDAELNQAIYTLAEACGGSFAAEHGIGRTKTAIADSLRSPVERTLMARIQRAIDPNNRMNPGVIV